MKKAVQYPPGWFTQPVRDWAALQFHSRLCDPRDELCILSHAVKQRLLAQERKEQTPEHPE